MNQKTEEPTVCILGLGYVGLPLALEFAKSLKVIAFDVNEKKMRQMSAGSPPENLVFTSDPTDIARADFAIIAVPTPLTKSKEPDLSYVVNASRTVAQNLKPGCVVVLESTVYPGVTEEVVKPIFEEQGWQYGTDFRLAYSPERVNPGDEQHTVRTITKVVSGMDEETTEMVARLYERIAPAVFRAKSIRTAEAAKVIENVQRDLNIALINELALIFDKIGLNTGDVLEAAATKWNFHRYSPGLVGGHCIPVDPYYLVHKAKELGYHPRVILAGRDINDYMPKYVAELAIKALNRAGKVLQNSRVLIMGLSYKEDVADTRETQVRAITAELQEFGIEVLVYDPVVEGDGEGELGLRMVHDLDGLCGIDGVILAVAHSVFRPISLARLKKITNQNPVLLDVKGFFDRAAAEAEGFRYRSL